jgi:ATP-binding cassette, subfamily C, type I secretion system permease/ATPase
MLSLQGDEPVAIQLRASARKLAGVAVFSGVVNLLTLSGSIYMLQVYDRVIPSRNIATLLGLSAIVLIAFLLQGYFDALRGRMLARIGALFDAELQPRIYLALVSLPLRGTKPILSQQPLRDLDQVRAFLSGTGPTAFLDMPWIPLFLIALFLFHPAIGVTATCGAAAIVAMTLLTEYQSRSAVKISTEGNAQRQVLADALRGNADVIRALGMTGRWAARWSLTNEDYIHHNTRLADVNTNLNSAAKILRFALQSAVLGVGAYLVVVDQASGGIMIASAILMGRALAPVEVALTNWKQLVAAREGISRLRAILKATAAPGVPAVVP